MSIDLLREKLAAYGQSHLLAFWDQLDDRSKASLQKQIEQIDFELIRALYEDSSSGPDWADLARRAESPPAIRLEDHERDSEAVAAAEEALRSGELGVVLVAGGQGSRLGYPHPKGMYPIGPVSKRSLFQMHVEKIRAIAGRYDVRIPLFLMTSPATHDETVDFFQAHENFGLADEDLHIFCQGSMPAVDAQTGKVLLAENDRVFLSPDGHGGMLAALDRSGGLSAAKQRGIRHLFYFQVDNPLAAICDTRLVGYHLLAKSEMTTLVIAKEDPLEKVGNVVFVDDRMMVIEYSDLPDEAAKRIDEKGNLVLWAGSIAVHVFDVDFLDRMARRADSLPFHRAQKIVPYVDDTGRLIEPSEANAIKFERFIFDLMPEAQNPIAVEGDPEHVFAPLKNASGAAKDTPETTRAAIVREARRMLEAAGGTVDGPCQIEISPLFALDANELKTKIEPGWIVDRDTYLGPQ